MNRKNVLLELEQQRISGKKLKTKNVEFMNWTHIVKIFKYAGCTGRSPGILVKGGPDCSRRGTVIWECVSLHITQAEGIGVPRWGGGGTTELKSDMGRQGAGTGKGKTNPR